MLRNLTSDEYFRLEWDYLISNFNCVFGNDYWICRDTEKRKYILGIETKSFIKATRKEFTTLKQLKKEMTKILKSIE